MLPSLPSTYAKEKLGPKLCEIVSGEAEELVEHLPISEIIKKGCENKILELLDEKYKTLKRDDMHTALKEFFYKLEVEQGEHYRQLW